MVRVLTDRRVLFAAAVVIGGLLALALWPRAIEVEVATVSRGPLTITVTRRDDPYPRSIL